MSPRTESQTITTFSDLIEGDEREKLTTFREDRDVKEMIDYTLQPPF